MRAISREEYKINIKKRNIRWRNCRPGKGRISIIGIGPGGQEHLSRKAYKRISESGVIAGYRTYIDLLGNLIKGKKIIVSGMTQEKERAESTIKEARKGNNVCLISSGDPGIYGTTGLILGLLGDKPGFEIEIIPGITAVTACASLLGAPLMHDFAVISLSDILTGRRKIEDRLNMAAKADFVISLYNPKSKKRTQLLNKAWKIISKYRSVSTPVGIVKNAYRAGEKIIVTDIKNAARLDSIDMLTTVIIGNSQTFVKNGYMITPRGYILKKSEP